VGNPGDGAIVTGSFDDDIQPAIAELTLQLRVNADLPRQPLPGIERVRDNQEVDITAAFAVIGSRSEKSHLRVRTEDLGGAFTNDAERFRSESHRKAVARRTRARRARCLHPLPLYAAASRETPRLPVLS
jgi:hypothetical protein